MNIKGQQVVIRAIERADLPHLQRWANDPEIQTLIGGWHFPASAQDHEQWFARLSCNSLDQRFAIDLPGTGIIGTANLVQIDWKNRTAFHGMLIGDKSLRGRGLGADTIAAIMRYAFDELGLERLDSDIIEYNSASLKTYLGKCGWVEEGRRPQWYFRAGRRWDKVIIGITRDGYRHWLAGAASGEG